MADNNANIECLGVVLDYEGIYKKPAARFLSFYAVIRDPSLPDGLELLNLEELEVRHGEKPSCEEATKIIQKEKDNFSGFLQPTSLPYLGMRQEAGEEKTTIYGFSQDGAETVYGQISFPDKNRFLLHNGGNLLESKIWGAARLFTGHAVVVILVPPSIHPTSFRLIFGQTPTESSQFNGDKHPYWRNLHHQASNKLTWSTHQDSQLPQILTRPVKGDVVEYYIQSPNGEELLTLGRRAETRFFSLPGPG